MPKARAIFHPDEREYTDEEIEELRAGGLLAEKKDQPLPPGGIGRGVKAAVLPDASRKADGASATTAAKETAK